MKTTFTLFAVLAVSGICSQENYTLKMQMRMEGLPPEYAAYADQEILTYLKGDKSRTEMTGVMYSSTVYFDGDTLTTLNDMMGNKQGFKATKKQLEALDTAKKAAKPEITYTSEKKNIAGYECTKAIIKVPQKNNEKNETIAWVTERIKANQTPRKAAGRGVDLGDLKGQPLEMEINQSADGRNVKIIMTTTQVLNTPLHDSLFTPHTGGYTMMSFEDWQKKMKNQRSR